MGLTGTSSSESDSETSTIWTAGARRDRAAVAVRPRDGPAEVRLDLG